MWKWGLRCHFFERDNLVKPLVTGCTPSKTKANGTVRAGLEPVKIDVDGKNYNASVHTRTKNQDPRTTQNNRHVICASQLKPQGFPKHISEYRWLPLMTVGLVLKDKILTQTSFPAILPVSHTNVNHHSVFLDWLFPLLSHRNPVCLLYFLTKVHRPFSS